MAVTTKQVNRREIVCDVELALDVIGGKWKGAALFHLCPGPLRFSALQRTLPRVTQRMLTLQLRELEADGLVHREVFPEVPPRVEYSLTEFGRSLEPVLMAIGDWGIEHRARLTGTGTGTGDVATDCAERLVQTGRP